MEWQDVLMIIFSAVAANHLGLVAAVESVIRHRLPVANCPKCAAFWCVLAYGTATVPWASPGDAVAVIAAAFLSAWSAVWLDLFMGLTDKLYLSIYDKIYPAADTADADATGPRDTVSGMPAQPGDGPCHREGGTEA